MKLPAHELLLLGDANVSRIVADWYRRLALDFEAAAGELCTLLAQVRQVIGFFGRVASWTAPGFPGYNRSDIQNANSSFFRLVAVM